MEETKTIQPEGGKETQLWFFNEPPCIRLKSDSEKELIILREYLKDMSKQVVFLEY